MNGGYDARSGGDYGGDPDGELGGELDGEPGGGRTEGERELERERTFAALPPARGRGFAFTWWGQAWLRALEDSALDGEQVRKGRRYARAGAVGAVSVRPGRLTAVVSDPDGTTHRTDVLVQRFAQAEWNRFLDVAAAESGHIAALLDREMPPELAQDAAAAGVELLPGIGDLDPRCDCGEWDHCAHTAALCHQLARLLDQDPLLLLLMRGLGEREVLRELQERNAASGAASAAAARRAGGSTAASGGAGSDAAGSEADGSGIAGVGTASGSAAGVDAAEAFGAREILPPLPAPPPLPEGPGQPPLLDTETEPGDGLDPGAVEFLAEAAAGKAHRLLAQALAPGHAEQPLAWAGAGAGAASGSGVASAAGSHQGPEPEREQDLDGDLMRLAAVAADVRVLTRLAAASGRDRPGLGRAVRAWRYGGPAAVAVLEEAWQPAGEAAVRARAALDAAWDEGADGTEPGDSTDGTGARGGNAGGGRPLLEADGNRWTVQGGAAQLRLGRDGRWWPYRRDGAHWEAAGPAEPDPAAALSALDSGEFDESGVPG